jgi:hypothetical protein
MFDPCFSNLSFLWLLLSLLGGGDAGVFGHRVEE